MILRVPLSNSTVMLNYYKHIGFKVVCIIFPNIALSIDCGTRLNRLNVTKRAFNV